MIRWRFYPASNFSIAISECLFQAFGVEILGAGTTAFVPEEIDIPPSPELVERDHGGSVVAKISRDIVRVHARFYGRGPTRAKTVWRDEIVICVLDGIFTKAELLLIDGGRFEDVRLHRIAFQDEVAPLLRAGVEAVTGRRVRSFLSQVSIEGAASEVFILGDVATPPPV